ncbi:MAG: FecR domain-containing protein [Methylophilus sp.]|nr:FecR domain-containing protein [Methylophilus sp.]
MSSPAEHLALQQASEWFAVLNDTRASDSDHQAWQAWLAASPAHAFAWQEVESVHASFQQLNSIASKPASFDALRQSSSRRDFLKVVGFAGASLFSLMLIKRYSPWQDWVTTLTATNETYSPPPAGTSMVVLADKGKLWLNANSQANVEYGWMLRRITLLAGEILLQSGHDEKQRPLVVDTLHGRLTALGTRFTVRQESGKTLLAVYQGQVAINPTQGNAKVINAGSQAYFDNQTIQAFEPASPAREAWTRGMLIADNSKLEDFVAELSNYTTKKIFVARSLAHHRVMGVYPFSNVPVVMAEVANSLSIRLRVDGLGNMELLPKN